MLGLREAPGRPLAEVLLDFLRAKQPLLILDNCEHLVAPAPQLADALLRACPGLRILATSREALGIAGETVCRCRRSRCPTPRGRARWRRWRRSEAVQLFVDARPPFSRASP